MGELFAKIKACVVDGRYIIGDHAVGRLEERSVLEWQIVDGIRTARLLIERPRDKPNPSIESEQILADGAAVKAVWSYIKSIDSAKLVTVHFFDE